MSYFIQSLKLQSAMYFALGVKFKDNAITFSPNATSLKHPGSSSWFRTTDISGRKLDPEIVSWFVDQGSLTNRLMGYCPARFSVRVLSQLWVKPKIDEAKLLNIPLRQTALLRQAQLLCDETVCVYARSIKHLYTTPFSLCAIK